MIGRDVRGRIVQLDPWSCDTIANGQRQAVVVSFKMGFWKHKASSREEALGGAEGQFDPDFVGTFR